MMATPVAVAIADPRSETLSAALVRMEPRRELVYRVALMGISPHCRGDARWIARAQELQAMLRLRQNRLAAVFAEAGTLGAELIASAKAIQAAGG